MDEIKYIVEENKDGKLLRDILKNRLKISSGLLTKIKHSGGIYINGRNVNVNERVKTNDQIKIVLPNEISETIIPVNIPLEIVFEDEYLLIVNKPKDMPTHPSIGNRDNTLANACMYYYRDTNFVFRPVNRLDRDTTGIVIIAKDARTSAVMSEQMKNGTFKKTYYAITQGIPLENSALIDAPIGRCDNSIIKREVRKDGQRAITEYSVIKTSGNTALVEIILHTGRTHQIRVHFSHLGTPLLYDYLYGTEVPGKTLFLHCGKVKFFHPFTDEEMEVFVPYNFPVYKSNGVSL